EETNLYYLNARYYSPIICRFISYDDIEYLDYESINGLNLYCYCFNNPILYIDSSGHFPVVIEIITTFLDATIQLYEFGLECSLKSLKNAPKITMNVAKKMARKGGHVQSARQIIRDQEKLINSTQQSLDDVVKFERKLGKILLIADIVWSLGENMLSGDESWFTDTLVDASVSLAIYGLSFLPGGFFISLAATVATSIWEDEIEKFKDRLYNEWVNFWSFSWI
ncbi:MAG: RHS repeat-associated core domain-containing protein, partial [Bacilli bacterium]|nr:RHS repeat-associated core domain-containing protein [Bacilli bacterium]